MIKVIKKILEPFAVFAAFIIWLLSTLLIAAIIAKALFS